VAVEYGLLLPFYRRGHGVGEGWCVCVSVERPVHYSESVVDVTMRWARWPEEYRHGNYLVVKPTAIYSEIEQVVRRLCFLPTTSLSLCLPAYLLVSLSVFLSISPSSVLLPSVL